MTPTRWVEVPPGTGIMMVWMTKASAVSEPMTGSDSAAARPKWRRAAQRPERRRHRVGGQAELGGDEAVRDVHG